VTRRRAIPLALAAVLLTAQTAGAQDVPIPDAGAWKMVRHAPPAPDPPCFARIEGPEVNTSLLLTRTGAPIVTLGKGGEWSFPVHEAAITASVDGGPAIQLKATLGINLVLIPPSPELTQQLHAAQVIDWTLPFGHFRGRVAGYDAALAAIRQCIAAREGASAQPKV
jgi:hypothetical protein